LEDVPAAPTLADVPGLGKEANGAAKRVNPIKVEKMRREVAELEGQVERLEGEIAALEAELGEFKSAEDTQRKTEALGAKRTEVERLMARWEELSAALEES
jgi:predicted RNase H-like nuclease (RuvC/YqgF family)